VNCRVVVPTRVMHVAASPRHVSLPVRSAFTGELLCELAVNPRTSTVGDLKVTIELATGIPRTDQLFTSSGGPLSDKDRIGPGFLAQASKYLSLVYLNAAEAAKRESRRQALAYIAADGRLSQLTVEQRGDAEVVLAAVAKNVCNISAATEEVKCDPKTMLAAVRIHPLSHCYANEELWCDRDFVLGAVDAHGDLLKHASKSLQTDPEVVLVALEQEGHLLKHASPRCRRLREVVLAAVKQKGTALCYAPENLKDDQQIALAAVRQDPEVRGATRLRSGDLMFQDSGELQTEDEACSKAQTQIA